MGEFKCPLCESTLQVPDVEGHYECPDCKGIFEYEGVESDSLIWFALRKFWPLVVFFILFTTASVLMIIFGEPCDNCGI